jgi:hypothetical protein
MTIKSTSEQTAHEGAQLLKEETPSPAGTTCDGIGTRRLDYSVKLSRSRAIGRK